jgi:hypothetical protein
MKFRSSGVSSNGEAVEQGRARLATLRIGRG